LKIENEAKEEYFQAVRKTESNQDPQAQRQLNIESGKALGNWHL
jgi:hypothetical protein